MLFARAVAVSEPLQAQDDAHEDLHRHEDDDAGQDVLHASERRFVGHRELAVPPRPLLDLVGRQDACLTYLDGRGVWTQKRVHYEHVARGRVALGGARHDVEAGSSAPLKLGVLGTPDDEATGLTAQRALVRSCDTRFCIWRDVTARSARKCGGSAGKLYGKLRRACEGTRDAPRATGEPCGERQLKAQTVPVEL